MITPEQLAKPGSEHSHQTALFCWANQNKHLYPCLEFMNGDSGGMPASSKVAASRMKAAGNKKGFPDIFLPFPTNQYHGLFIELKRPKSEKFKKGVVDQDQKTYMMYLNQVGYLAVVCFGYEQAIVVIEKYLFE